MQAGSQVNQTPFPDVIEHAISVGLIHGTLYMSSKERPLYGVVLSHGFSGNRFGIMTLAKKLAQRRFLCLSIDVPQHYENKNDFSLGLLSETICESVALLRKKYGFSSIYVIGHSISALGALFATSGYTRKVEQSLYAHWQELQHLSQILDDIVANDVTQANNVSNQIEQIYSQMKILILEAMTHAIRTQSLPESVVLLAPPLNAKSAMPGLSILNKCPFKVQKAIFEAILHKPAVKQGLKDGNVVRYQDMSDKNTLYWQCFSTNNTREFMSYFLSMKEPIDYLQLIEHLIQMREKDDKITFFEYFQKKIKTVPKLFVYGKRDLYLLPFLPGRTKALESYYRMTCENAIIKKGDFTHVMMNDVKQQFASVAVESDEVTAWIYSFLTKGKA